jgi:hypothetical protein
MTTKTPEHVTRWRENHHRALETLRAPGCALTGLQLWRKLVKIEREAHDAALRLCNDSSYTQEAFERAKNKALEQVEKTFGQLPPSFFVNSDPRGYALKLDNDKTTIPEGMHRDMGGYGILAAIIE